MALKEREQKDWIKSTRSKIILDQRKLLLGNKLIFKYT